jgi:hypothetical protein
MKKIEIKETKNGQLVQVSGFIKAEGQYVFKATELLQMLEFVGELVVGRKVEVREK